MIVEVIRYRIAEGQEAAFEDAYRQAQKSLADSPHCLGYQLVRCFKHRSPTAPKMLELLRATGSKAGAGSVAEAAAHGEVVVFATPWAATQDAVRQAGDLAGKVILDCTNPLKEDLSGLAVGHTTSGAEQMAAWASSRRVVKVFNTTGFENMAQPSYGGTPITMFFAGDDAQAKLVAAQLAQEMGFDPVDAGPLANARLLEPMALLWIYLAVKQGHGTGIAYKLVHR